MLTPGPAERDGQASRGRGGARGQHPIESVLVCYATPLVGQVFVVSVPTPRVHDIVWTNILNHGGGIPPMISGVMPLELGGYLPMIPGGIEVPIDYGDFANFAPPRLGPNGFPRAGMAALVHQHRRGPDSAPYHHI